MNISAINTIDKVYVKNIKSLSIPIETNNINSKNSKSEIEKNSLSEVIGRSQVVSFSGTNKTIGKVFEHECSELRGNKEHIKYDKTDGSLVHEILRKDGTLYKKEEYYPADETEIITTVDDDGKKTIITKFKDKRIQDDYDNTNRLTQSHTKYINGDEEKEITDYDLQRKIILHKKGNKTQISVLDLETNLFVTSGDKAKVIVYDEETDTYLTINVVTGKVYKEAKYMANETLLSLVEYAENSDKIARKITYSKRKNGYNEEIYDENGILRKYVFTSLDRKSQRITEYDKDGITPIKDVQYTKEKDKTITVTNYKPGTNNIIDKYVYNAKNQKNYIYYKYHNAINTVKRAEYYIDGKLNKIVEYYEDGKSIAKVTRYLDNSTYFETYYTRSKDVKYKKYYKNDGTIYAETEYSTATGNIIKEIKYDLFTKGCSEKYFNETTRKLEKTIKKDNNNNIIEEVYFYEDGETPKKSIKYSKDGSYSVTYYNEEGRKIKVEEYNADNTHKNNSNSNDTHVNSNSSETFYSANSDQSLYKKQIKLKLLRKINNSLAHNNIKAISLNEWTAFSEIVGIRDIKSLMLMENDTYKELAKKFHTDTNKDTEDTEISEEIIRIINSLHTFYKKNKKQQN